MRNKFPYRTINQRDSCKLNYYETDRDKEREREQVYRVLLKFRTC